MYSRIPMYRGFRLRQRFGTTGSSILSYFAAPQLRRKAQNSWAAVQDTYFSTKDIFENHKVVFTVSTSIASVATAWAGYLLREYHQSRIDQRLDSIEKSVKTKYDINDPEFKKLVSGGISVPACVATAGTTMIIGYGLGWRGGKWFANKKFKREQMKLLGQIKPRRWPLRLPLSRLRLRGSSGANAPETPPASGFTAAKSSGPACNCSQNRV
ncbi:hypothetical protein DM860_002891 [Cuscuta australis]|uniref:Uncharacterized protein n=2 Tax=Cuscuta sect. Cleistogrammica TaxID=1824901 RepID=A0A328D4I1_9ASTE|nr:hypothetical protein DM860_002891 [Cuscuta australis]